MKIDDFLRRWAFHYVNPDFLKIPMGEDSGRVLPIRIGYNSYSLRSGGNGEYVTELIPPSTKIAVQDPFTACSGYLFKEEENKENNTIIYKLFSSTIYTYTDKDGKTYYKRNQYITDTYSLKSASEFVLPSSGTYYFLLYDEFTKRLDAENITTLLPKKLYKIIISKDFFDTYSIPATKPLNNSSPTSNENYKQKIILFSYYNLWKGVQSLPNLQEDVQTSELEEHEWYTTNSGYSPTIYDIFSCDFLVESTRTEANHEISGHEINPCGAIHQQIPEFIAPYDEAQSHSIQLNIVPFDICWKDYKNSSSTSTYRNKLLEKNISSVIHNYTISKNTVTSPYQRQYNNYILTNNQQCEKTTEKTLYDYDKKEYCILQANDTVGGYKDYILADLHHYCKKGLFFDDNVILVKAPEDLEDYFQGWSPERGINVHDHRADPWKSNGSWVYYYSLESYGLDMLYSNSRYPDRQVRTSGSDDVFFWNWPDPNHSYGDAPSSPKEEYQGSIAFIQYPDRDGKEVYQRLGTSARTDFPALGSYSSDDKTIKDLSDESELTASKFMSLFPYHADYGSLLFAEYGTTASFNEFVCINPFNILHSNVVSVNENGSHYWYNGSDGYIALSNKSLFTYKSIPNVIWYNSIYVAPGTDPSDYTTWTPSNVYITGIKESWESDSEYISPPTGWLPVYNSYVDSHYDDLSPELQRYLGHGYQDFTQEALLTTMQRDGYENELGKLLNEIAAPKDLL